MYIKYLYIGFLDLLYLNLTCGLLCKKVKYLILTKTDKEKLIF